jgi:anti-sigma regulatory factor (Ser/Thr protein kinase)
MALDMGMDAADAESVAIVVTEACTNVLKHGGGGQILLQRIAEGEYDKPLLELLAMDQGPGMADLGRSMRDGYSTGGSAGEGLGAISRMSQQFDIYTQPSRGTALLARWWLSANGWRPSASIGSVNVPKPGEEVCGDSWGAAREGAAQIILVADGLGHGLEAKVASSEAVRQMRENPGLSPKAMLMRVHEALRSTRGAAVAIAQIDSDRSKLYFAGVGNISARIYAGSTSIQHLVSLNGTAGHQCERIQEFSYPWPKDGLLIMHSDGLTSGAGLELYPGLANHDPSLIAGVLYRDFCRGRDDATVVCIQASHETRDPQSGH